MPGHRRCWYPTPAEMGRCSCGGDAQRFDGSEPGHGDVLKQLPFMAEPELGSSPCQALLGAMVPLPAARLLQSTGWFWGRLGTQLGARRPQQGQCPSSLFLCWICPPLSPQSGLL